ncbi:hypothetical protein M885DRAFT_525732 [Pelagophyceae sp. CCMP2097]|nr:hypothetical protein M885DRAFT_525732 [Pelagophyceae sp. CCMP2097]|mmetsp:Transcript_18912/g.65021  ORF Transcript_18912/g.65021 Transcript_18912/m.65021 type:complete len:322 (+) Transcript_18912:28-993(+)
MALFPDDAPAAQRTAAQLLGELLGLDDDAPFGDDDVFEEAMDALAVAKPAAALKPSMPRFAPPAPAPAVRAKTVVDFEAWLENQEYFDDLKFVNADEVRFTLSGETVTVEQDRRLGKGGHIWDGSYVLCEQLLAAPPAALAAGGAKVLALGAGAGLEGILISKLFPKTAVTITDGDSDICALAKRNVERNGASEATRVLQLWWKSDEALAKEDDDDIWRPKKCDTEVGDSEIFDLIVAAEAVAPIYDAAALVATLKRHSGPKTELRLLSKDGRWPLHAQKFYDLLRVDFDFTSVEPLSRLKAPYFRHVSGRRKASSFLKVL